MDAVAISSKAQTIKENVMLFEDILEDLQAGYVDPVNPTKLFETAVSAMLKVSTFVIYAVRERERECVNDMT